MFDYSSKGLGALAITLDNCSGLKQKKISPNIYGAYFFYSLSTPLKLLVTVINDLIAGGMAFKDNRSGSK